jgi:hypothetical protein
MDIATHPDCVEQSDDDECDDGYLYDLGFVHFFG